MSEDLYGAYGEPYVEEPAFQPGPEVPCEPPVEPVCEPEPVYEAPVEPVYEAPVEPVYEAPVEPVYEAPVEPVYEAPVEPVPEAATDVTQSPVSDGTTLAAPTSDWVVPTGACACGEAPLPTEPAVDPLVTATVEAPLGGPVTVEPVVADAAPAVAAAPVPQVPGIDFSQPHWQNVPPNDPALGILRDLATGPSATAASAPVGFDNSAQLLGEIWGRQSAAMSNAIGVYEGYTATYDRSTGSTGYVFEGDTTPSTPISTQAENNPRSTYYDPD